MVSVDGELRSAVELISHGPKAFLQYPPLTQDAHDTLYAAWTTSDRDTYLYPTIHAMKSLDGGVSWQALDGTSLSLPVVSDETGPTTRISRDDERDVHSWLSALMAKDGKLHFAYWAKTTPQRQRYLRYDSATGTLEVDIEPMFVEHPMTEPTTAACSLRIVPCRTRHCISFRRLTIVTGWPASSATTTEQHGRTTPFLTRSCRRVSIRSVRLAILLRMAE